MSKLTIIQLLNKIANGEEIPKKVKFNEDIYTYHGKEYGYCKHHYDNTYICINSEYYLFDILNDKVEIIEEDKEIEKLEKFDIQGLEVSGYSMTQAEYLLEEGIQENRNKINELIDKLNSLENNQ